MGVESASDLSVFFELDDFGDAAKYYPTNKAARTVNGIFDNPDAKMNVTDRMDVTIPQPQFACRTVDVKTAVEGERLDIRGVRYTIRVIVTDGTGVSTLFLERY